MANQSFVFVTAIAIAAVSIAAGQERPKGLCQFDGFGGNPKLAEVVTAPKAVAYFGCDANEKTCPPTSLSPGDPILIYQESGDWTCGYISQANGSGPGWVRSKDIQLVRVNENPPLDAWLGTWKYFDDKLSIKRGKVLGALALDGEAYWHGMAGSVHVGDINGQAAPTGNHMHYEDGSGQITCTVDLTLLGRYLMLNDNAKCGGMNVRFSVEALAEQLEFAQALFQLIVIGLDKNAALDVEGGFFLFSMVVAADESGPFPVPFDVDVFERQSQVLEVGERVGGHRTPVGSINFNGHG